MSIPERLFRIAKYKLNEVKDRLDRLDEEAQRNEEEAQRAPAQRRSSARRELDDALNSPLPPSAQTAERSAVPPVPRRTPEEIARGSRPLSSAGNTPAPVPPAGVAQSDPLASYYAALGVEPGADFTTVQAAYNRLAARCEPSRFPAGSPEEQQARDIRKRLDASYKVLRDALDPTARRFDLLEFDTSQPPR